MDDDTAFFILNQVEETLDLDRDAFLSTDIEGLRLALELFSEERAKQTGLAQKGFTDRAIERIFDVKEEVLEAELEERIG